MVSQEFFLVAVKNSNISQAHEYVEIGPGKRFLTWLL